MLIHNANVTGSMHLNGMDMSNLTGSVSSTTFNQYTSSTNEFTGSANTRIANLDSASGSLSTRVTGLESFSSSLDATFATDAQLTSLSSSVSERFTSDKSDINSLNSRTGSYTTTGSNTFNGTQTITGSLFITENLTVLGSSSISYVSQSNLNIGTNLITVNAQNPTVRFGGLAVIDSGSAPQVSGSWLFDSIQNRWIMIHEQAAGNALTSSIALMGPETYNNLGNETTISTNRLVKGYSGASGEHVGDSNISDNGSVVSINSNTQVTGSLTVNGVNTVLENRTLSINGTTYDLSANRSWEITAGISAVSAGTGISTSTLNGVATVTNTGLLTGTAGTGISVFTSNQNLTITNTGLLTGTAGTGISVSTVNQNLTITNTGLLSGAAGAGINVSTTNQQLTITNTGLLTGAAGTGISVSTVNQQLTITNTGLLSGAAGTGISVSTVNQQLTITNTGVTSFNTRTGGVTLQSSDISGLGAGLVSGSSQIDHNATTNYVANRHIDHSAVSISAGSGLTGGGDITTTRTLSIATGGVTNSMLANSTISGIALGSNLATLTIGTGLSGTSYNGGTAVTIANTGVTSITAGSGISVNAGTGGVTVTNTITNNNQLTNGAGYITGINSSMVTTALGYTPYNSSNPSGYITGINSSMVTTALGYTPYNSSNPSGYITGINSTMVTNALGYTPYNSSNPSGYITSSALSSYLALSGGTMTGAITTPAGTAIYIGNQNVSTSSRLIINWHTDSDYQYVIGKRAGAWTQPMDISFYTGIRYHAHQTYNAHIFYVTGYDSAEAFSIGKGDSNVRVNNTLFVSGDARAPIFYDQNDTGFYIDPNSTSVLSRGVFTRTDDHAISVGTIRGRAVGSQSGEYIMMYERVAIGSPVGWGSRGAPSYGLSTYGGADLATDTGFTTSGGSMRSPIFYDSNDTGRYIDPASTSQTNSMRASEFRGNANVGGTGEATWHPAGAYIGGTMWQYGAMYKNNTDIYDISIGYANSSFRAPIFYDSNDTGYYADFNSTSDSALRVRGGALFGPNTTWGASLYVGTNGRVGTSATVAVTNGNLHLDSQNGYQMYLNWYSTEAVWTGGSLGVGSASASHRLHVHGTGFATSDFRAPIFYDSGDTGYYIDPNDTSNLWRFTQGTLDRHSLNSRQVNSPWSTRSGQGVLYQTGAMGWGQNDFNVIGSNWGSGFFDTWSSPGNAPGGSSHYVGIQAFHYSNSDSSRFHGWQMACAQEATNRWFLRSAWDTPRAWVEIIHGGNIGSQSVSYASSAGNADTTDGYHLNQDVTVGASPTWSAGNFRAAVNVGTWGNSSDIYMTDGDEGTRRIHCNSNRVGFLTQADGWGSYCNDNGSWESVSSVTTNDWFYTNGGGGLYFSSYARGIRAADAEGSPYGHVSTYGSGRNGWSGYAIGSRHCFMSTTADNVGVHDTARGWIWYWNGSSFNIDHGFTNIAGSARSPIFYDNNDTGYYVDPNGTSYCNRVDVNTHYNYGWYRNFSNNTGLYSESTTMHLSSKDNGYFDISSTNTVSSIRFWTGGHISALRGYIYADTNNHIGFLNTSGNWSFRVDNSGNTTATGDVTAYSDARVKTNVNTIENALEKTLALRGVTYTRIDSEDGKTKVGVIAQEIIEVLPEVVNQDNDGMYNVSYGNITALLIEAIKEQQSQIEELKTIINGLTK